MEIINPISLHLLVLNDEKKTSNDSEIQQEINKINNKLSKIENIKKYFTIN